MGARDLLIVAGEASGDLHGGRLLAELRSSYPELRPFGLGGAELEAAGLDALAAADEISVVGITEVLRILSRAREIFHQILAEVDRRKATTAILIDFPDFNLRLARKLHQRGVRVIYYISPQVWAWRRRRVHAIAKTVDRMLVVLPFEEEFYRLHGVEALHVGHPLIDEVPQMAQAWDAGPPADGTLQVALLPGSRRNEVESLLPILLAAGRKLQESRSVRLSVIKAPSISVQKLRETMGEAGLEIRIVEEDRFGQIAASHLALCAVGTAALEVGLLRTPMVVVHKVQRISAMLGRMLLRLPSMSLVNLILQSPVVPELLQAEATSERIYRACDELLASPDRIHRMQEDLARLRGVLGERGASRRAALAVADVLGPILSKDSPTGEATI